MMSFSYLNKQTQTQESSSAPTFLLDEMCGCVHFPVLEEDDIEMDEYHPSVYPQSGCQSSTSLSARFVNDFSRKHKARQEDRKRILDTTGRLSLANKPVDSEDAKLQYLDYVGSCGASGTVTIALPAGLPGIAFVNGICWNNGTDARDRNTSFRAAQWLLGLSNSRQRYYPMLIGTATGFNGINYPSIVTNKLLPKELLQSSVSVNAGIPVATTTNPGDFVSCVFSGTDNTVSGLRQMTSAPVAPCFVLNAGLGPFRRNEEMMTRDVLSILSPDNVANTVIGRYLVQSPDLTGIGYVNLPTSATLPFYTLLKIRANDGTNTTVSNTDACSLLVPYGLPSTCRLTVSYTLTQVSSSSPITALQHNVNAYEASTSMLSDQTLTTYTNSVSVASFYNVASAGNSASFTHDIVLPLSPFCQEVGVVFGSLSWGGTVGSFVLGNIAFQVVFERPLNLQVPAVVASGLGVSTQLQVSSSCVYAYPATTAQCLAFGQARQDSGAVELRADIQDVLPVISSAGKGLIQMEGGAPEPLALPIEKVDAESKIPEFARVATGDSDTAFLPLLGSILPSVAPTLLEAGSKLIGGLLGGGSAPTPPTPPVERAEKRAESRMEADDLVSMLCSFTPKEIGRIQRSWASRVGDSGTSMVPAIVPAKTPRSLPAAAAAKPAPKASDTRMKKKKVVAQPAAQSKTTMSVGGYFAVNHPGSPLCTIDTDATVRFADSRVRKWQTSELPTQKRRSVYDTSTGEPLFICVDPRMLRVTQPHPKASSTTLSRTVSCVESCSSRVTVLDDSYQCMVVAGLAPLSNRIEIRYADETRVEWRGEGSAPDPEHVTLQAKVQGWSPAPPAPGVYGAAYSAPIMRLYPVSSTTLSKRKKISGTVLEIPYQEEVYNRSWQVLGMDNVADLYGQDKATWAVGASDSAKVGSLMNIFATSFPVAVKRDMGLPLYCPTYIVIGGCRVDSRLWDSFLPGHRMLMLAYLRTISAQYFTLLSSFDTPSYLDAPYGGSMQAAFWNLLGCILRPSQSVCEMPRYGHIVLTGAVVADQNRVTELPADLALKEKVLKAVDRISVRNQTFGGVYIGKVRDFKLLSVVGVPGAMANPVEFSRSWRKLLLDDPFVESF